MVVRLKQGQHEELANLEALFRSGIITRWGVALDGGANVGGWSRALAARFTCVLAFEPAPDTFALLKSNVVDLPNVSVFPVALMDKIGLVDMIHPGKSQALTNRCAKWNSGGASKAATIDSLTLPALDFLKLDLEGAEPLAISGAHETLTKLRPFVVIEEFGHSHRYKYVEGSSQAMLEQLGYRKVWEAGPNQGFQI